MASSTAGLRARDFRKLKPRNVSQLASFEQAGVFFKNFLRHPLMLGSAVPSSRYLISRMLDHVDWEHTRTIVEYGPGVGTFTRPILERMSPEAKLLAIELNDNFAALLRTEIPERRLQVAHGSCVEVKRWMKSHQMPEADCILSGIPFTVLPVHLRHKILISTRNALASGGVFVLFQYTRTVLPHLQKVFSSVEEDFEPLNILPARVYVCRK